MYSTASTWNADGAFAWTPQFVKPGECPRCSGRGNVGYGNVSHVGVIGRCYTCHGAGQVETDEATIAATKEAAKQARRYEKRMEALRAWESTQRIDDRPTAAQLQLWHLQNTGQWDAWNAAVDGIVAGGDALRTVEYQLSVAH
jgi:hypothetical protein